MQTRTVFLGEGGRRREPTLRDVARLKLGAEALALAEPSTVEEARTQLGTLHDAICAMQSLDDLGSNEANAKAMADGDTLLNRHQRLKAWVEATGVV